MTEKRRQRDAERREKQARQAAEAAEAASREADDRAKRMEQRSDTLGFVSTNEECDISQDGGKRTRRAAATASLAIVAQLANQENGSRLRSASTAGNKVPGTTRPEQKVNISYPHLIQEACTELGRGGRSAVSLQKIKAYVGEKRKSTVRVTSAVGSCP